MQRLLAAVVACAWLALQSLSAKAELPSFREIHVSYDASTPLLGTLGASGNARAVLFRGALNEVSNDFNLVPLGEIYATVDSAPAIEYGILLPWQRQLGAFLPAPFIIEASSEPSASRFPTLSDILTAAAHEDDRAP
jgi:hypothetical protein